MKSNVEKISGSQLTALIMGILLGESIILPPGANAGRDAWIAIIIGICEGFAFVLIHYWLWKRFPDMNLVQIIEKVYGKYIGKIVSLLYIWFFLHSCSIIVSDFTHFCASLIYIKTPKWAICFLLVSACAYAVKNGIEVLARCSQVIIAIVITVIIIITLLMIPDIVLANLKPVMQTPLPKLLWSAHGAAIFPFGETTIILMVINQLNKKSEALSSISKAMLIAVTIFIVITVRNISVLGSVSNTTIFPSIIAITLIDIGQFITRLEAIIAVVYIAAGFIKCSLYLYGATLGISQVLHLRSYRPLAYPIAILAIVLSLNNFSNILEILDFLENSWPIYAIPFEFGIPLLTLIIAYIRKPWRKSVLV